MKYIAIWCRVSSNKQSTKSQEPDSERWAAAQDQEVRWFRETASGLSRSRRVPNYFPRSALPG
jgi:hypothetical protein